MITNLTINNFKSIVEQTIPLSRINVFIGENGSGKSNILEAIGMLAAAKNDELRADQLFSRGIRVAKPELTINSFLNKKNKAIIEIIIERADNIKIGSRLSYDANNSRWIDLEKDKLITELYDIVINKLEKKVDDRKFLKILIDNYYSKFFHDSILSKRLFGNDIMEYVIFNVNQNALRGLNNDSKTEPLGIYGEGLDVLINNFNEDQRKELLENSFISWLDKILIDETDEFKMQGYKLGRSTSKLYFADKFMRLNNRLFSAENANEGALHILFYLALFISEKTPGFFAIDNIETALNPFMCRKLMLNLSKLAIKYDKQTVITTHNPAILDGMDLNDPNQSLFVVKRDDTGRTVIEKIKFKPKPDDKNYKLSELWMRGYLGGLPTNF